MPPVPGAMLRTTMRAVLIRFTVTLTPGCLDRMVATNCSLTGRTNQQRYKVTCGAAEFAETNPENWSHGEQIVIVNARLRPGHPRLLISSPRERLGAAARDILPHSRDADSTRALQRQCPSKKQGRREGRVPDAPAASHAKTKQAHERSPPQVHRNSGLPCAMVLTAYNALSSATNFVLSPSS